jgi:holo-[acyl-carrier protein] synthase
MIIGTGVDIVEIKRIQQMLDKHAAHFYEKILTPKEGALAEARRQPAGFVAGRWAAKEAVVKALGVGFGKECGWLDVEILNDARGKPEVTLHGVGKATAESMGIQHLHVSISHEQTNAIAFVIAES